MILLAANFGSAATVTIALTLLYVSEISTGYLCWITGGTYPWFVISIGQFSSLPPLAGHFLFMPSNLSMACDSIL